MHCWFEKLLTVICVVLVLAFSFTRAQAEPQQADSLSAPIAPTCTCGGYVHEFEKCSTEMGFGVGGAVGPRLFASSAYHDYIFGTVHVGRIITNTICPGRFGEGNFEVLGELFGGYQVDGGGATFGGFTPFIRYNFTGTHSPFVPFLEGGVGGTGTDIGKPDLGTTFNFNLQAGLGIEYFFCPNMAATFETRLIHFSDADLGSPNLGANTVGFILGVTWFM